MVNAVLYTDAQTRFVGTKVGPVLAVDDHPALASDSALRGEKMEWSICHGAFTLMSFCTAATEARFNEGPMIMRSRVSVSGSSGDGADG